MVETEKVYWLILKQDCGMQQFKAVTKCKFARVHDSMGYGVLCKDRYFSTATAVRQGGKVAWMSTGWSDFIQKLTEAPVQGAYRSAQDCSRWKAIVNRQIVTISDCCPQT